MCEWRICCIVAHAVAHLPSSFLHNESQNKSIQNNRLSLSIQISDIRLQRVHDSVRDKKDVSAFLRKTALTLNAFYFRRKGHRVKIVMFHLQQVQ